jgi:plasmid stabilization system protein ParE
MVRKIEWSIKAQDTFESIIAYLETEWTEREATNFASRVYEKLELLRSFPKIGSPDNKKKNVYRTLIHKKVSLVYHYKPIKNEIVLITFWNSLQNPERLIY